MGIIGILLVVTIPAVTSLTKAGGRNAAATTLAGAFEQARAQAIKSGQPAYVVFPVFAGTSPTSERYHHKSYAIFETDQATPTVPKQITTWKTLPTGTSIRTASIAALPTASAFSPPLMFAFTPDPAAAADFRCVQFNSAGGIESPGSGVSLVVFEGNVSGGTEIVTSAKDASGNPLGTQTITVARLTGRTSVSSQ